MGIAATWFAVPEEHAEKLIDRLGFAPTGLQAEVPASLIWAVSLSTGWRVIWYNKYECPCLRENELAEISNGRDLLVCRIEEHVMTSSCELWEQGQRRWWISHEGENGANHLSTDGKLPESFAPISAALQEAQRLEGGADADVDYIFDVPLKIAQSIVGFKHDEDYSSIIEGQFVVLSPVCEKKGPFRKLFS